MGRMAVRSDAGHFASRSLTPIRHHIMSVRLQILAGLLLPVAASAQAARPADVQQFISVDAPVVALVHARVIDGTGAATRAGQTLILDHGLIKSVGDSARVAIPSDAKVIDLTGKSVMPGMVMVHEHVFYPSGGGSVYNEIQPGSYVFMDADYGRNLDADGAPLRTFRHSLFVLTTVMSRPTASRAVVDAGLKAHSIDSGLPLVADLPGARYSRASDEHGVIELDAGQALPLGAKIRLIPGHCDPTVNLHDWLVCMRNGIVEAVWPIAGRGAFY